MKKLLLILVVFFGFLGCGCSQNVKYTSMTNSEFAKVIKQKKTQVVDVRSLSEFSSGHLRKAVNIDVNCKDFDNRIEKLNKKKPVAVYCRSGRRSKIAAQKLSDKGFTVYELDKGIQQWDGEIVH